MKSFDEWLNEYAPISNAIGPWHLWDTLQKSKDMRQAGDTIYKLKSYLATHMRNVDSETQERIHEFMPAFTKEYYRGMYPERWKNWTDELNYIIQKIK